MALGPVFRHEMLAAGRKRRFFLVSVGVGLGMLLLMWACVASANYADEGLSIAATARLTSTFYTSFIWATLFGVLIATPLVVAGAIASERERRTIEYLFATDLSNAEIVLDKLAARLLTVGRLVLAAVPVLAIFRLMGGVPGRLLLWHFAMIASTALMCAAIALVVSVWCERARDAVTRAGGCVFAWLVSSPILLAIGGSLAMHPVASWASAGQWLLTIAGPWSLGNPVAVFTAAGGVMWQGVGIDAKPEMIGWMILWHLVAAALLIGLAVMMVRRVHLRAVSSAAKGKRRDRRAVRRRGPSEARPMLWKEMHAASVRSAKRPWIKRIGVTLFVAMIVTPLAVSWYFVDDYEHFVPTSASLASLCGTLAVLAAGSRAAGLVSYEHERETWLSLLTTDLSAGEIVHGKLWGNLWALRWMLIGCVAIMLSGGWFDPVLALLASAGYALVLGLSVMAATAAGLAVSLRVKSSTKAVGLTVGILLAVGGLYPLVMAVFMAISGIHDETFLAVFVASPCVPFVMALPGILLTNEYTPDGYQAMLVAGLLLYSFLAFATTVANINAFDRLCGRSTLDNLGEVSPRPVTG